MLWHALRFRTHARSASKRESFNRQPLHLRLRDRSTCERTNAVQPSFRLPMSGILQEQEQELKFVSQIGQIRDFSTITIDDSPSENENPSDKMWRVPSSAVRSLLSLQHRTSYTKWHCRALCNTVGGRITDAISASEAWHTLDRSRPLDSEAALRATFENLDQVSRRGP